MFGVKQLVIKSDLHECLKKHWISLWRNVPVLTYPCWDMIVIIWQDYSQFVVLWFDKNKVHGFFVFLFCCSVEAWMVLWLLQQVDTLPFVIHKSFLQKKVPFSINLSNLITETTEKRIRLSDQRQSIRLYHKNKSFQKKLGKTNWAKER